MSQHFQSTLINIHFHITRSQNWCKLAYTRTVKGREPQGTVMLTANDCARSHSPLHPVGRSINSDWCVNSFIMVVYENFFFSSVRILCPRDN